MQPSGCLTQPSPSSQQMHLSSDRAPRPSHPHTLAEVPAFPVASLISARPLCPPVFPASPWGLGTAYIKKCSVFLPRVSPSMQHLILLGIRKEACRERERCSFSAVPAGEQSLRLWLEARGCQLGVFCGQFCIHCPGLWGLLPHVPLGSLWAALAAVCLFSSRWRHYVSSHFLYEKPRQYAFCCDAPCMVLGAVFLSLVHFRPSCRPSLLKVRDHQSASHGGVLWPPWFQSSLGKGSLCFF